MLTTAKLNSPAQAIAYHEQDYSAATERYYSQENAVSEWAGPLALELGLSGEVGAEAYKLLANGQSPSGHVLVKRREKPAEYIADGKKVKPAVHTVGWDLTFSASQSISAAVILGPDPALRRAHEEAVKIALNELGRYVQARLSKNRTEMTGKWVAAIFHHDSARPVGPFASVNLHDHVVLFNMTQTAAGKYAAIQSREIYNSKKLGTSIYRAELAGRLAALGYQVVKGEYGQPEIAGYKAEFLKALAVRKAQIEKYQEEKGVSAQVAAHRTREPKRDLKPGELFERNMELAAKHGVDPGRILAEAMQSRRSLRPEYSYRSAQEAVSYAVARNFEREAVADERALVADALIRGLGDIGVGEVRTALDSRYQS